MRWTAVPLFRRTSPPRLAGAWLFICDRRLFCPGDNLQADIAAAVSRLQRFQSRNRKKVPVQQKQGVPERAGGTVSILYHLHHMGGTGNGRIFPLHGSLETVMEPDAQGNAGPAAGTSRQNAQTSKHMPMDVFRLCRVFGFLKQFFYPRHTPSFLGLLYSVPYQNISISFLVHWSVLPDSREPAFPYLVQ